MSSTVSLSNNLPEIRNFDEELVKYNVNSFLDYASETLQVGKKVLQEVENNEQKIRSYKQKLKYCDYLCCSIPKLIVAVPLMYVKCIVEISRCFSHHFSELNYCETLTKPWLESSSIQVLESLNNRLRTAYQFFKGIHCISSNPENQANLEVRLIQVTKLKDSQYLPLICDYLESIPQIQKELFLYDDKWCQPIRESTNPKVWSHNRQKMVDRLYEEKYFPMSKVLLSESFLKSFELTIQLRSKTRDILIQERLPEAILDSILIQYIGIPTAEEEAKEKASEEEVGYEQNNRLLDQSPMNDFQLDLFGFDLVELRTSQSQPTSFCPSLSLND